MTSSKQPHPQRCETCKNVDCDLHEQGKGNRNPETGYEWDHHYWYHKIIDEMGCASHSSATAPATRPPEEFISPDICNMLIEQGRREERAEVLDALKSELEEMGCMGDVCCRDYLKNEWLARKQEGKP